MARSRACSRPATPFSSHKLWENDCRPRMERVQLNGADIESDVRGSGAPVVFIHGAILSDGFVPVIEQTGIAENFQIVHYRRRVRLGLESPGGDVDRHDKPGGLVARRRRQAAASSITR